MERIELGGLKAGITGARCSPHSCHHTFAKNYLLNGGDIFSLQKILGGLLKKHGLILICPEKDTEYMTRLVSALSQMLPQSARLVTFITAPLSRPFRREGGDKKYRIKLIQERPSSLWNTEEYIDISQGYEAPTTTTPQNKSAHYLVDEFRHYGYEGVRTLHKMWEGKKEEGPTTFSSAERFITAFEVSREIVSLEAVKEMLKKGKKEKEEAKRYAMVMLDEHKWKNAGELLEIFTVLIEGSTPQAVERDILRLINETQDMEPCERLDIYERIISNLPRIGNELFSKLKGYYGDSLLLHVKDLSRYPEISSRLFNITNYDSFEWVSKQLLQGSFSDSSLFGENLRYIMGKIREQFGEQILDFTQHLLVDFPRYEDVIIQQLQKEDLIPASVKSRLPKDMGQRLLTQAEKILQILRGVLTS